MMTLPDDAWHDVLAAQNYTTALTLYSTATFAVRITIGEKSEVFGPGDYWDKRIPAGAAVAVQGVETQNIIHTAVRV